MNYLYKEITEKYREVNFKLIDLAEYDFQFSDGRNYLEYEGDTGFVTKGIMEADATIIGTPTFQTSIPAILKNIFDGRAAIEAHIDVYESANCSLLSIH